MTKEKQERFLSEIKDIVLVLLGCFILALADVIFIIPSNIVNGGVDSLGIILNYYLEPLWGFDVSDIFVAVSQIVLWLLGLFLLGKKFSFHTLLGSLAFPAFYSLLLRINFLDLIGFSQVYLNNTEADGSLNLAFLMLSAIFGGFLSGVGVALAYLGDGSTGGFDVISFIIAKYGTMKQDFSGFLMDSSLIILGLICMKNWELALVGIISAVVCAFAINAIYIRANSYLIADIISSKPEIIQKFIHEQLGHATTVMDALGGYSGEKKTLIRVVIYKKEEQELKNFIASVDASAFVSTMTAKAIHGDGFEPFELSNKDRKRILAKYGIATKEKKPASD
jgi:uncharacterized membrane-anchored protein YitT (DUF2179 family)